MSDYFQMVEELSDEAKQKFIEEMKKAMEEATRRIVEKLNEDES